MATNINPIFPKSAVLGMGVVTAGNVNYDGLGATTTIITAGADGARIDSITLRPLGTNVATVFRLFIQTSGGIFRLLHEVTLPATTAIQTAALTGQTLLFNGIDLPQIVLPANALLFCTLGTTVAAGYSVIALGGSYTA